MSKLTREALEKLGNEPLTFCDDDISFECRITEIADLKSYPGQDNQPFSVIFECGDESSHPQSAYQVSHPSIGEQQIFIVPVGQTENGTQYEAVFN